MIPSKWSGIDAQIAAHVLDSVTPINQAFLRSLSPDQRDAWAQVMAGAINAMVSPFPASADALRHGQEIQEKGVSVLGPLLTDAEAKEAREYFLGRPVFNTHAHGAYGGKSDEVPRLVGSGAEKFKFGAYAFGDIVRMPHFLKIATNPLVVGAARQFLGAQPTIYSINAWWSFPGHDIGNGKGQIFHRDKDYTRFCAAFTYLTDVDVESGPHHYLEYSHDIQATQKILEQGNHLTPAKSLFEVARDNYGHDDVYLQIWKNHLREVTGPAGTAFMANTYGLHRGLYPVSQRRLIVWVRYALFAGPFAPEMRVKPDVFHGGYPVDEHARYMLRGLVEE